MSASGSDARRHRITEQLREAFAREGDEIAAAYLFGSLARDEATPQSDVDVAILYRDDPPRTLDGIPGRLQAELGRALGRPVDLVVLNHAPVDLVHRVLRDGILVAETDRSARIDFEVRARNQYWDILPLLKRYRESRSGAS